MHVTPSVLKKWSFKEMKKFLEDYGFMLKKWDGSHCVMTGTIKGQVRQLDIVHNHCEKNFQSGRTMKIIAKYSGIPLEFFEEWRGSRIVHQEIIG